MPSWSLYLPLSREGSEHALGLQTDLSLIDVEKFLEKNVDSLIMRYLSREVTDLADRQLGFRTGRSKIDVHDCVIRMIKNDKEEVPNG